MTSRITTHAAAVYVTPDSDVNGDGDEITVHHIYVGDEHANPIGEVTTTTHGRDAAITFAEELAESRDLPIEVEGR